MTDIRNFLLQLEAEDTGVYAHDEVTPVRISQSPPGGPQPGQQGAPMPPAKGPKPDEVEVIRIGPQPEGKPGKKDPNAPKIKESEKSDTSKPKKPKEGEGPPKEPKKGAWDDIKKNSLPQPDPQEGAPGKERPVGKDGKALDAPLDSHEILKRSDKGEAKEIAKEIMARAEAQRKERGEFGEPGSEAGDFLTKLRGLYKSKIDWVKELKKKLQEFRTRTSKAIDKMSQRLSSKYKLGMGKVKERSYVTGLLSPRAHADPRMVVKGPYKKAPMTEMLMVVALDVSGSMGQETLERVMGEVDKIASNFQASTFKAMKGKVYFMAWDMAVTAAVEYTNNGWKKYYEEKEGMVGGGGTDPRVIFKYIDAHTKADDEKNPQIGVINILKEPNIKSPTKDDIRITYEDGKPTITPFMIIATDGGFGKMDKAGLGELYKDKQENILWLIIDGDDRMVFPRNIIRYEDYKV